MLFVRIGEGVKGKVVIIMDIIALAIIVVMVLRTHKMAMTSIILIQFMKFLNFVKHQPDINIPPVYKYREVYYEKNY